jgi:hypothetical protein
VDCYLLYFRQQLITSQLLAFLPFQSFFTESSHGDQLLAPTPFSGALTAPCPFCCVLVCSSLFIVQFLFYLIIFLGVGVSLARALCWFIPGVPRRIPSDTWCSPVGLLNVS